MFFVIVPSCTSHSFCITFGIRFLDCSKLAINRKNDNCNAICKQGAIDIFLYCRVSFAKFSYWSKFHVSIINGSRVLTILFYKLLTGNQKFKIPPSEFCQIFGDWPPNLAQMSLIKCHWMLENPRFTAFIVSELLRVTQQGEGWRTAPPQPRLGLTYTYFKLKC